MVRELDTGDVSGSRILSGFLQLHTPEWLEYFTRSGARSDGARDRRGRSDLPARRRDGGHPPHREGAGHASVAAVERVDCVNTFIAIAPDCPATQGSPPPIKPERPSVAARTYQLIAEHPYEFTSSDVIFTVFADRQGIPEDERPAAREQFYSRSQACLRSSDLGKRYGWGIHADDRGRLALYGIGTAEYAEFVSGQRRSESGAEITLTSAMRSARGATTGRS